MMYSTEEISNPRSKRWEVVQSIMSYCKNNAARNRNNGRTLANILHNLPDASNVNEATLKRELSFELGSDVSKRFGAKLFDAFLDFPFSTSIVKGSACRRRNASRSLHRHGGRGDFMDGKDEDGKPDSDVVHGIDARYIVTTYRAALLATSAFQNPRHAFLKLVHSFPSEFDEVSCGVGDKEVSTEEWPLADILKIVSIAAITDEEVECTAGILKKSIGKLTNKSLNPFSPVTLDLLLQALDASPSVIHSFKSQLVAKLSNDQRLSLLAGEEDKSLNNLSKLVRAMQLRSFQRRQLHKLFLAWKKELRVSKHAKKSRKSKVLLAWSAEVGRLRLCQMLEMISQVSYSEARLRKCFKTWSLFLMRMKKIKRCYVSETQKRMMAGVGYLRTVRNKVGLREAFATWKSFYFMEMKGEIARWWNETKILRLSFGFWHTFAMREQRLRILDKRAEKQQSSLQKYIQEIDAALKAKNPTVVAPSEKMLLADQTKRQQLDAQTRKGAIQRQIDADILSSQRDDRRKRVREEKQQMEQIFESKWARRKAEAESLRLEGMKSWTNSSEYKNRCMKEERELMRFLSIEQSSTTDEEKEVALASRAVIAYSILDGKMACAGVVPDEIFHVLRRSPNNAISREEFENALNMCRVKVESSLVQEMFHHVLRAKSEAVNKSSGEESISLQDLYDLRNLSRHIGAEGTVWKMYVSPIHQQLVFHNNLSNQQQLEKDIRKKHIKQIIRENIHAVELKKVRQDLFEEKRKDHQWMVEDYAARSLQSMYHQWKCVVTLKKQMWVLDRMNLFKTRSLKSDAAHVIQKAFFSYSAKCKH